MLNELELTGNKIKTEEKLISLDMFCSEAKAIANKVLENSFKHSNGSDRDDIFNKSSEETSIDEDLLAFQRIVNNVDF